MENDACEEVIISDANKKITGNGVGLFYYNNDGTIHNPDGSSSISRPFWGRGIDHNV
jgi:hypothetical protein